MKALVRMVLLLVGLMTPGLSAPASATLTAPAQISLPRTVDDAHVAPATLTGDTRYDPRPWVNPGRHSCRDCTLEEVIAENVRTRKFSAAVGDLILHSYRENTVACYTGRLVDEEVQISSFHHLDGTVGTAWVYPDLKDSSWDGLRDKDVYICPVPGTGFALTKPDVCSNWNFVPTPEGSGGGYVPPVAQFVPPPDTGSGGPEIYWPSGPFDWFGPPGAFAGSPPDFGWPGFPGGGYSGGYVPPGGRFPPPSDESHHHGGGHHGHRHHHKPPIKPPTVPVPEPATLALLLSGVIGLFVFKKSVR